MMRMVGRDTPSEEEPGSVVGGFNSQMGQGSPEILVKYDRDEPNLGTEHRRTPTAQ